MWMLLTVLLVSGVDSHRLEVPAGLPAQETRSVPKDSVEVVGIVRRAALDDQGVGMRIGRGTRVVIGAPGNDPTRMNTPSAAPSVAAMDLIAIRVLEDRCPIQ